VNSRKKISYVGIIVGLSLIAFTFITPPVFAAEEAASGGSDLERQRILL